jgi:hypothetical protein
LVGRTAVLRLLRHHTIRRRVGFVDDHERRVRHSPAVLCTVGAEPRAATFRAAILRAAEDQDQHQRAEQEPQVRR